MLVKFQLWNSSSLDSLFNSFLNKIFFSLFSGQSMPFLIRFISDNFEFVKNAGAAAGIAVKDEGANNDLGFQVGYAMDSMNC